MVNSEAELRSSVFLFEKLSFLYSFTVYGGEYVRRRRKEGGKVLVNFLSYFLWNSYILKN